MEKSEISLSEDEIEDLQSRRFEDGYSLSADVSESESSTSSAGTFSSRNHLASVSTTSSPAWLASSDCLPPPPIMLPVVGGRHVIISPEKPDGSWIERPELSEAELMKERFAKLLLGEDMSGGGKGVSTALAISNAITNLAACVFGELWKLEPLSPQKKSMWRQEMEWLLYVSYSIVELIPSVQEFPGGGSFEVMVTQQRSDLFVNLPALKKLDAMLINILDGFLDNEFYYVDRGIVVADGEQTEPYIGSASSHRASVTLEEKWWLPFPKVPAKGLSEGSRKLLQHCKEHTHEIFKAAVAINSSVLSEMEVPQAYLENLPKLSCKRKKYWRKEAKYDPRTFPKRDQAAVAINSSVLSEMEVPQAYLESLLKSEKACLGEILHRFITADQFSPDCLLDYLDLSSECSTLEIANRIESAVHFWRSKCQKKKLNRSKTGLFWGSTVKGLVDDTEKSKTYAHRADTFLKNLKLHLPGLPQTALDVNKIQYNKDVGQSILESYSRVIESLAFNLMARIDDLLYVDDATKRRAMAESLLLLNQRRPTSGRDPYHQTSWTQFFDQCSSSSSHTGSPCRFPMPGSQRPTRLPRSDSQSGFLGSINLKFQNLTF